MLEQKGLRMCAPDVEEMYGLMQWLAEQGKIKKNKPEPPILHFKEFI